MPPTRHTLFSMNTSADITFSPAETPSHLSAANPLPDARKRLTLLGMLSILIAASDYIRRKLFHARHKTFSESAYVARSVMLWGNSDLITVKAFAQIKDYVIIQTFGSPVVIGENTQVNPFTVMYNRTGIYIGKDVMIAPHCMIASGNHNFKQLGKPMISAGGYSRGPIVIEDDVWIGANSTITDGVRIGQGAVVGANCVVTRDVKPYDIVVGVPARVIGSRKVPVTQRADTIMSNDSSHDNHGDHEQSHFLPSAELASGN
jgi:acetyltransferase-like isoleucine patch superfamily enzyme